MLLTFNGFQYQPVTVASGGVGADTYLLSITELPVSTSSRVFLRWRNVRMYLKYSRSCGGSETQEQREATC